MSSGSKACIGEKAASCSFKPIINGNAICNNADDL